MITTKWRKYPVKKGTPATTAAESLKSSFTLKALNDFYIIEEEPVELTVDSTGGLTKDVVSAVESGKLFIPEAWEFFIKKFPCRGKVVAKGTRLKLDIPLGARVMFAQLGGQRWEENGRQYVTIKECDIHAILC